jgi:hypothetical protein
MQSLASFWQWVSAWWVAFWKWVVDSATGLQGLAAIVAIITALCVVVSLILRFRHLKTRRKRRNRPRDLPIVSVGYDVFPDAMPLLVGIRLGVFKEEPFNISVSPKQYDWNSIFTHLERREVDVIFWNKDECKRLTDDEHARAFHYCGDLTDYYGFAIMIHKASLLQPFTPFAGDREGRLRRAIRQLNGKKVFASGHTDHSNNLVDCLRWAEEAGESHSVEIISEGSPWEGLRLFLKGKVEAYVGGISQRLIAENYGAVPLVTQEDLAGVKFSTGKEIPLFEQNGFVVLKEQRTHLESSTQRLILGWKHVVKQLDEKNPRFVEAFLKELNNSTRREMRKLGLSSAKTFDAEDFKRFWNRWIIMHIGTTDSPSRSTLSKTNDK